MCFGRSVTHLIVRGRSRPCASRPIWFCSEFSQNDGSMPSGARWARNGMLRHVGAHVNVFLCDDSGARAEPQLFSQSHIMWSRNHVMLSSFCRIILVPYWISMFDLHLQYLEHFQMICQSRFDLCFGPWVPLVSETRFRLRRAMTFSAMHIHAGSRPFEPRQLRVLGEFA